MVDAVSFHLPFWLEGKTFVANHLPKRTLLFTAASVLIIAVCLFIAAAFTGEAIADPNPFTVFGGIVIVSPCILIALAQYFGAFRHAPLGARIVSIAFYGVSAIWSLTLFGAAIEMLQLDFSVSLLGISLTFVAAGMFATALVLAIARANWHWANDVRTAIGPELFMPNGNRYSICELMVMMAAVAMMIATVAALTRHRPPNFAEHVDAAHAPFTLPPGATDISYCQGFRGTIAYEFTTNEAAFRTWVESGIGSLETQYSGTKVTEITYEFQIRRYHQLKSSSSPRVDPPITNGLYYAWTKEDKGIYAAFDRRTNRAYYQAHYH